MMKIYQVLSVNTAKASNKPGGAWVTKPFHNWKKAVAKMRA